LHFAALLHAADAQSPDPVAAGIYDDAAATLEELLRGEDLAGAALSVIWPGLSPWHYAVGWAAREENRAFTIDTPNAQHELAQLFTAVAVMQLVEAGQVDLDAPFSRYFPEFQPYAGALPAAFTVRQLLSHHSGLPAYYAPLSGRQAFRNGDDDENAWREVLAHGAELTLVAAPGQVYEYSYLGYDLLGLLIERQSGERYADYVGKHILTPLGLNNTAFRADPNLVPDIAHAYEDGQPEAHERQRDVPAAGLVSSVRDVSGFLQALLQGGQGILKPDSVAQLFQAQNASPHDDNLGFGLGFFVSQIAGDAPGALILATHSAINDGARTYLVAIPRHGLGVVLTTTSELGSVKLRTAVDSLIEHMLQVRSGQAIPLYAPHPKAELTEQRAALLPSAFSGPGGIYRVERRRGGLRLDVPFLPFVHANLVPREEDYYSVELRLLGFNLGRLSQLEQIAGGLEGKVKTLDGQRLWYWYLHGVAVATLTELVPAPESDALTAWRERTGTYEAELTGGTYQLAFDVDSGNLTFGRESRGFRRWRQAPELFCAVDMAVLRSCNMGLLGTRTALRMLTDGRLVDAQGAHYRRR
jgi:CubicO group peptidase (beta-lactamase class C family)